LPEETFAGRVTVFCARITDNPAAAAILHFVRAELTA
jgi:hypothetical protein